MENVTTQILAYREAARTLWNCHLREEPTLRGGAISSAGALHDWEALKQLLFCALVLRPSGHEHYADMLLAPDRFGFSWAKPLPFLRVELSVDAPVLVSRRRATDAFGRGYWDHAVNRLAPGDAEMAFIDFFDFGQAGYLDFRYYHVMIEACSRHPTLAGHEALIEVDHGTAFLTPVSE